MTLLKGEVTKAQFEQALRQLLQDRAKGNDALVYFTGLLINEEIAD